MNAVDFYFYENVFILIRLLLNMTFDKKGYYWKICIQYKSLSHFSYNKRQSASSTESRSTGYFNMHVYPGEAFDRAADGSAVTSHYRSVNQRLSKLGHTGHVLLLVGVLFAHQTYREVLGGASKLSQPP